MRSRWQIRKPGSIRVVAFASLIGTTIEWYDFFLYGTAAALVFNRLFFPTFDPLVGTLLAFGTYSVGFVARPIGGIVIGHYGDKIGRKSMLVLTLMIMGVATFLIGLLPTYATIGPCGAGPAGRAADRAGIRRRRRMGRRGADGGRACAAGPARLLRQLAADRRAGGTAAVDHRLFPVFADAGGGVPVVGLARAVSAQHPAGGRRPAHPGAHPRDAGVREDEGNAPATRASRSSRCCGKYPKEVLLAMGARLAENGAFYIYTAFVLVYAMQHVHMDRNIVLLGAASSSATIELAAIPLYGALSDRIGRRPGLPVRRGVPRRCALTRCSGCSTPGSPALVLLALLLALHLLGTRAMYAPQGAFFSELFGTSVRYSGASLGAQLSSVLAGGLSPIIAVRLLQLGYGRGALSLYLIGMAAITIVSVVSGDRDDASRYRADGESQRSKSADEGVRSGQSEEVRKWQVRKWD